MAFYRTSDGLHIINTAQISHVYGVVLYTAGGDEVDIDPRPDDGIDQIVVEGDLLALTKDLIKLEEDFLDDDGTRCPIWVNPAYIQYISVEENIVYMIAGERECSVVSLDPLLHLL